MRAELSTVSPTQRLHVSMLSAVPELPEIEDPNVYEGAVTPNKRRMHHHSTPNYPTPKRLRLSPHQPHQLNILSPVPELPEVDAPSSTPNKQFEHVQSTPKCSTPKHPHVSVSTINDEPPIQSVEISSAEDSIMELQNPDWSHILAGAKLTDNDIAAFQELIRNRHADINGLQNPILAQCSQFKQVTEGKMLQIFHESSRHHWVLVAARSDIRDGIVEVYDSVYTTVSAETMQNICAIMPAGQYEITVNLMNAQRQRGNTDCGVFVCAFMERLARSEPVAGVTFDVAKLRFHLVQCLRNETVTPFPTLSVKNAIRKEIVQRKMVHIVCSCRAIWHGEVVVECSGCGVYFHPVCANVGPEYIDNSRAFHCNLCCKV